MMRRHEVVLAGSLPAVAIRALIVLCVVIGAWAIADAGPWPWIAVVVALAAAFSSLPITALGSVVALLIAMTLHEPAWWRTAVLAFAIHGIVVSIGLASWIPLRSRVLPGVLRPTLRRFVAIQAVAQGGVAACALLIPSPGRTDLPAFVIIGAVALVLLGVGVALLWGRARHAAAAVARRARD